MKPVDNLWTTGRTREVDMFEGRDVAAYITQRRPGTSDLELFKLAYYAQAWHAAWEGTALFDDRIEAWKYGPVPVGLRDERRYGPHEPPRPLDQKARDVIDAVLDFYGSMPAWKLMDLSHDEDPWRHARGDLPEDAYSSTEITVSSMRRFYTKQSLQGKPVPTRRSQARTPSREETLAAAEVQNKKWHATLAWLADK